jgi:hypothetical protein
MQLFTTHFLLASARLLRVEDAIFKTPLIP